ncbi:SDR family NAD(P)-dependent oxidoreductase [Microlunatus parietis]|uniref:NAD(P)-dependent dehydrogenase (Short-subunit alcohol dehydrogenase family) n=1 Tax=Microlunatus parietis TaxID=682979 RepID=A0A7Y9IF45_9ACTN|nr:SDR family NAD(P)-dependent oxidoreductase [Microlunatus parietis]NYE75625.1 NAD(P)-dependent dehydrogenase (short-subunit alcohol dehydrogenase family) [Microlunatus parietis]
MATISGKTVLITGANRGIGRALLEEALSRGAWWVHAGTRETFDHPDERVTPLILDVTDPEQIQQAVASVQKLDLLINNAGVALPDDLSDPAVLERHLAVNLFGLHAVTQAFLPQLIKSGGAIVNCLSTAAIVPIPIVPGYSISKAAALSLTQSQRELLLDHGVRVHAVLTGPTDTDMNRGFNIPKASPASVAQAILDGVENEDDDIFPDSMSRIMTDWQDGAVKALRDEHAIIAAAARPA